MIYINEMITGNSENGFDWLTYSVYQIFLLFWVIMGIGYLAMILNYITKAMKSKHVRELEHIIEHNLKRTPQKIREELRTILNEVILHNVKRIYKDEDDGTLTKPIRSQSCPDLTLYRNEKSPTMARKRAFSECPVRQDLVRVQSETDLERIDKERTFSTADAMVQPSELLLRVVNALGSHDHGEESDDEFDKEGGYHGFSDSQILASENAYGSTWTLGSSQQARSLPPGRERQRAASEGKFPFQERGDPNDLTWYGPGATKKLEELRERARMARQGSRTISEQANPSLPQSILARLKSTFRTTNKEEEKAKNVDVERQDYARKMSRGRRSTLTVDQDRYLNQTARGRASVFTAPDDPLLEKTSIAELVRALTAITVPESLEVNEAINTVPKRKLGTAGITPPR